MIAVVGGGWVMLVLWGAHRMRHRWLFHPIPANPVALVVHRPHNHRGGSRPATAWVGAALRRVGVRVLRRSFVERPELDARVGLVVVAGVLSLLLNPVLLPFAVLAAGVSAGVRERRARTAQVGVLTDALPDAIDLLWVAVSGGATISLALGSVAAETDGPLGEALRGVLGRVARGERLGAALNSLSVDPVFGDALRPLSLALTATERLGVPLLVSVERLASEARSTRRRRAETRARRAPVMILFPLVCCTLPAFALLTVVPLFASGLSSLRLRHP